MAEVKEEEKSVGLFHDKMKIIKQYGALGAIVVTFPFWQPYLDQYLDKGTEKAVARAVKEAVAPLVKSHAVAANELIAMQGQVERMEALMINCKGGIKALNADEVNKIVRNAATLKAQRIRADLVELLFRYKKRDTPTRIAKFRAKVKESMQSSRKVYMDDIKGLQQRGIGTVKEYLNVNFPRKRYLDTIMEVVTEDGCEDADSYQLANDAYTYMLDIQDVFLTDMFMKMKESE